MQNEKRSSRKVVRAKAGAKVDVSARAKTAGYRSVPYIWFQRPNDLPPFTFATIRGMLLDPGIRLNFAMRAAPIHGAEFGFKNGDKWQEGMKCDSPEIGQFIYRQLMHIWKNFLPSILRSQVWGWSAGEVTLRIDQSGLVVINELEPRHAADCRLLKLNHERWGVAINRVEDSGKVHLPFPYAWFHAYNAEDGDNYGVSAALGGYSPWADKWFNGGAIDVRRLFMHKDAYGGMDLGYPDGTTNLPGHAQPVPNVDIAQQIADKMKSGGVIVRPSERDDNGNEMWPLTRAQVPNNPQHILQFPKDLDDEIRRGMEIPDDVISADGSGAWAGKRVTLASFYASLDHWVVQILRDLKSQIFDHLCLLNWGYVPEYEITHKPLAQQAMEQQANAGPGAGGSQYPTRDGDGDGLIGEGFPGGGYRMSLDPVQAVGRGVLSAGQLVEAAQRVMRMGTDGPKEGDQRKNPRSGKLEILRDSRWHSLEDASDREETREQKAVSDPVPWPKSFPNVFQMTTVSKMKSHRDYQAAKSGDAIAAANVVDDLIKPEKLIQLGQRHPNAIVVPVHAQEASGKNQLPSLFARMIGELAGLSVDTEIVQSNKVGRTGSNAWYRLAVRPKFVGEVHEGKEYVLVDDVVTGGGSLSELRQHIIENGGKVVEMVTLAAAQFSQQIALSDATRTALESKYDVELLKAFLKKEGLYNGEYRALTESEARTILSAGSLDTARNRIAEARS